MLLLSMGFNWSKYTLGMVACMMLARTSGYVRNLVRRVCPMLCCMARGGVNYMCIAPGCYRDVIMPLSLPTMENARGICE